MHYFNELYAHKNYVNSLPGVVCVRGCPQKFHLGTFDVHTLRIEGPYLKSEKSAHPLAEIFLPPQPPAE